MLSLLAACDAPRSYHECVLEKMKGQPREMRFHARELCESKFPFEKKLSNYEGSIDSGWSSTPGSLRIWINGNFGEHRITRYRASFSVRDCADILLNTPHAYTISKTFNFGPDEYSAVVYLGNDAEQHKCMRTDEIYGIRKRE
jgi:hypothetical protein